MDSFESEILRDRTARIEHSIAEGNRRVLALLATDVTHSLGLACGLHSVSALVLNAVRFSPTGTAVAIEAEALPSETRFRVSDAGRGIAADRLDLIFKERGRGLFVAKQLVEAHGGRMWADSMLGLGSTFFFTIPRPSDLDEGHARGRFSEAN